MMGKLTKINFSLSGKEYSVKLDDITPETTLNEYLRKKNHLTGTKKMCLEGGCGCCIVVVEEKNASTGKKTFFAVNSCLVSIFSCHGWKIHTIEGIGNPLQNYHKIQKLLADNNGTQCGFCSPGMVMNMYALNESGPITKKQIENSFGGNICRCTGYRPILEAFKQLAEDSEKNINCDIEDYKPCEKSACLKDCSGGCDKKQETISFEGLKTKWLKLYTLKDLLEVLATTTASSYMLVAGNTARGVFKEDYKADLYIDITSVNKLNTSVVLDNALILGGNMSLTNTMELFYKVSNKTPKFQYLSNMADHIDLVAHVPVRNIGTIAGNLMIKHKHPEFPSDIFLILEVVKATLVIVDTAGNESRVLPEDFLQLDMNKKVISNIILQGLDSSYKFGSYKIMPRAQNAHALVNAGFLFKLTDEKVDFVRLVYGGINPQFIHASATEESLKGKNLFSDATVQEAFQALQDELKPDHLLPDSSPEFRKQLAISLLYKFILSIAPSNKLTPRNKSGGTLLERPISSGTQDFGSNTSMYPITKPIVKLEALAQTSGQAQYVDDIPDLPNQLYAAFVVAKTEANSTIVNIDTSEALKKEGVVVFFGKDDIPGSNTFMPAMFGLSVKEELFCDGTVKYFYQPVGIIVAISHQTALDAADLVRITYTPPSTKPLLTVNDVLKAGAKDRIHHQTDVVPKRKGDDVKKVIKGQFDILHQYHYHMEVQCCLVIPTDDDGLDIYPTSQWMDLTQLAAAEALKVPTNKINVYVKRLGGAYGAKISRNCLISTAAALAAIKLRKPVKMWLPFDQNMNIIGKRFPLHMDYEVGVNNDGVIQYLNADLYSDIGVGGNEPFDSLVVSSFGNFYDIDTWEFSTYTVTTDVAANCYTRAPGTTEGLAAIESIIEHVAYSVNLDPLKVRLANAVKGKYPKLEQFTSDMKSWASIDQRKQEIEEYNKVNRWKKRGISVIPMSYDLEIAGVYPSLVSVFHGDGGVVVTHCGIEIGQGINTKVAQVVAYKFGIPMDKVSIKVANNIASPNGGVTGGSLTSEAVCYATSKACDILLEQMKPVKDKMKNPTWVEVVNECYNQSINLLATSSYSVNSTTQPQIQPYKIFGVAATEVEIDILTGQHQVLRVDIIEDVGDSLSPLIDIGQIEGAFVMGMGYYTSEEMVYDDRGQLYTNRTWTYKPPGAKDIPINFNIKIPQNNPNPLGVFASKAVAEPPLCLSISLPLAIRNAMASARTETDSNVEKWYPFEGPTTVEKTFLNSLNNFKQYDL